MDLLGDQLEEATRNEPPDEIRDHKRTMDLLGDQLEEATSEPPDEMGTIKGPWTY